MERTIEVIIAEYNKAYNSKPLCACTRDKNTHPHAADCPRGVRRDTLHRLNSEMDAIKAAQKAKLDAEREKAEDERIKKCFESVPATEERPLGGHKLRMLSHEEAECTLCGGIFFIPDLD